MNSDPKLRRALMAIAAAGTSLALLAACGGSSGGDSGGSGNSGGTTESDSVDPSPSSSVTLTEKVLKSVLLTAGEIGGDFEKQTASDNDSPLPCDGPNDDTLDDQAPPALESSTLLVSESQQAAFTETIKVYEDDSASSDALDIIAAGFDCTDGTLYSDDGDTVEVTLDGPTDVTASVGVDQVDGVAVWQLASTEIGGYAFVAQFGASLVLFTFVSPLDGDPAQLPDPGEVVSAALTKIVTS